MTNGQQIVREHELVVYIVDDNEANRELVQDLLDSVGLPWRSFDSAIAFLEGFDPKRAGCLVLDVRMPRMSGLQLMAKLKEGGFNVPTILVTAHGDVPMAIEAMKNGAFDFHEKPINNQSLVDSVQRTLQNRVDEIADSERMVTLRKAYEQLTPRERDVYALVVDGAMNKQIAFDLKISQRTVEVHRAKVMEKMAARSLADLIKMHVQLHGGP